MYVCNICIQEYLRHERHIGRCTYRALLPAPIYMCAYHIHVCNIYIICMYAICVYKSIFVTNDTLVVAPIYMCAHHIHVYWCTYYVYVCNMCIQEYLRHERDICRCAHETPRQAPAHAWYIWLEMCICAWNMYMCMYMCEIWNMYMCTCVLHTTRHMGMHTSYMSCVEHMCRYTY